MGLVTLGVDLGQKRDHTAIAVAETETRERKGETPCGVKNGVVVYPTFRETHFLIRHLELVPLGTSFPDIAARVAVITRGVIARAPQRPSLFIDATGATGAMDTFRAAHIPAKLVPTFFTHGDRRILHEDGTVTLGKAFLVSRLQALLQSSRLHLPKTGDADALTQELKDYEIRVDEDANDKYGAFRVGSHDDLVTALGLAVQVDPVSHAGLHQPANIRKRPTTLAWSREPQPFGGRW